MYRFTNLYIVLDVQSAKYVLCMYYTVFNGTTIEYKANCKNRNILYISHFVILTALLANEIFFSTGSYTATAGISEIVQRISEFITRRDGGAPSFPENIYISSGSQWSLMVKVLTCCKCKCPPSTSS